MQLTTVLLFEFKNNLNKIWGFGQVPLAIINLKKVPGLQFFKSMGTGGADGFGAWPNFSKYAWIMVWESHSDAERFFDGNDYLRNYINKCSTTRILYLQNIISNGKWSGFNPFVSSESVLEGSKIVVITRARIRIGKLWQFWQKVGKTAKGLYYFDDLEFAVGVGELPLIQQATISIWPNMERIKYYAYQQEAHKNVILLTRKNNWYSEELFARFYLEKDVTLG